MFFGHIKPSDITDCFGSHLSKHVTSPFNNSSTTSVPHFDLIHSNIWGPASEPT